MILFVKQLEPIYTVLVLSVRKTCIDLHGPGKLPQLVNAVDNYI